MLFRDTFGIVPGDEAWIAREKARRRREYTIQAVLILLLVAFVAVLATNVEANLAAKNIKSGFHFLMNRAGFEISDRLVEYSSNDPLWKAFFTGLLNTLRVSALTILTSTVLGIVVGLMRLSRNGVVRLLGAAHVEAYRNIPLLVLLLALYLVVTELLPGVRQAWHIGDWVYLSKTGFLYTSPVWSWAALAAAGAGFAAGVVTALIARRTQTGLVSSGCGIVAFVVVFIACWVAAGVIGGWNHPVATRFSMRGGTQLTPEFLTLWLGLTLYTSAMIAEIVRAGVQSVRPGQWDAAMALGFRSRETVSYIIFPQAMRLIVPPLASQYMTLTKNSSLAVLVGYSDLVNVGTTVMNVTGQALEVICIIMGVYLTVNLLISVVMNRFNARIMRAPQ
ncbi:amino acid ABC transporter permease [Sutterella sp.]|uniref:amino acid ABC transporter permease n=1 Tax=Sutterella sp. TaxID=1981025 RepID=UPI0026DEAF62|nr:ABC transporter permease subunit [Sutterella sp.]MDO5530385.1 ABC transporter permease subunit [Sutterella sp.]